MRVLRAERAQDFENEFIIQDTSVPFIFIGNGGKTKGGALQRGYSSNPVDGYLATDSNGNYTFIQTDYVCHDITNDGTITIGSAPPYTVDGSTGCHQGSGFHIVVVSRELPESQPVFNNAYCTNSGDADLNTASFTHFAGDLLGWQHHQFQRA